MKTSEQLGIAREYLDSTGWIQGALAREGSVCVVGALFRTDTYATNTIKALADKIFELVGEPISLPTYNDHHATCKRDVLDLFDKTIIGLEEVGE